MMRQLQHVSIAIYDIAQDISKLLEEGEKLYGLGNGDSMPISVLEGYLLHIWNSILVRR